MPSPHPTPQLNISIYRKEVIPRSSFSDHEKNDSYDSPSPYPPSSPSVSDSEDDVRTFPVQNAGLRTSLALLSEDKLRTMLFKLAESSPRFQKAIMKEIAYAQSPNDSPPSTPTTARPRRHRGKARRARKTTSISGLPPPPVLRRSRPPSFDIHSSLLSSHYPSEYVYHPGQLEEEVYEFLSGSPDDSAESHQVVRTITMWSCCDEDERSPGCVAAPLTLPTLEGENCEGGGPAVHYPVAYSSVIGTQATMTHLGVLDIDVFS